MPFLHFLRAEDCQVPVIVGDGEIDGFCRSGELCGVVSINGGSGYLLVPTGKGVGVLLVLRADGCLAAIDRRAVILPFGALQHRAVPVEETDSVLVDGVLCLDGHVTCDVLVVLIPTGEGVACANRVGRRNGGTAVFHYLRCAQYGIVPIDERDGIAVDGVLRFDDKVAGDVTNGLVPTGEGVAGAFGGRRLGCRTVRHFLLTEEAVVPVVERDGIFARRCLKLSRQHHVLRDITYFGFPAGEGVVVHVVGLFFRNLRILGRVIIDGACVEAIDGLYLEGRHTLHTVDDIKQNLSAVLGFDGHVGGDVLQVHIFEVLGVVPLSEYPSHACSHHTLCILSVLHLLGADEAVVPVEVGDGPYLDGVLCGHVHAAVDDVELLVPAGEGVSVACRVGWCRGTLAVQHFLCVYRAFVPVEEDDNIFLLLILSGNGQVGLYIVEFFVPSGEGIAFAFGVGRCRSIAAYLYRLALQLLSVPVLEGHGVTLRIHLY